MGMGCENVVHVPPGSPHAAHHMPEDLLDLQPAGILLVIPVDDIGYRADGAPVSQSGDKSGLAINRGHLLARPQIVERCHSISMADAICEAIAGATAVQPQHEARRSRRATVNVRIYAKRPMVAPHESRQALDTRKARVPQERAIGEYPKILKFRVRGGHALVL
jgi:hypothetical protein